MYFSDFPTHKQDIFIFLLLVSNLYKNLCRITVLKYAFAMPLLPGLDASFPNTPQEQGAADLSCVCSPVSSPSGCAGPQQ